MVQGYISNSLIVLGYRGSAVVLWWRNGSLLVQGYSGTGVELWYRGTPVQEWSCVQGWYRYTAVVQFS